MTESGKCPLWWGLDIQVEEAVCREATCSRRKERDSGSFACEETRSPCRAVSFVTVTVHLPIDFLPLSS